MKITLVVADEVTPAPTEEQMREILGRVKKRSEIGAVVLPERLEDEVGAPKVDWRRYVRLFKPAAGTEGDRK